ncbi:hypothetical protein AAG570_005321 [Ranatra chinensis]|uniref:Protein aurora borealis n=1 Tax=Ranatra chinensis TaxID=642074 RepID=A0ABD0Y042_9HEMI
MMETTPNRRREESPKSSLLFAAQARHYEKRLARTRAVSPLTAAPAHSFSVLPRYSGGGGRPAVVVNPFENLSALPHRLVGPTCSPDVFANVKSPSQVLRKRLSTIIRSVAQGIIYIESEGLKDVTEFHWTIEDISKINPAKIDSPLCQIDEAADEETESQVQEAIQLYFSTTHDIRSPADGPRPWVSFSCASTPDMCNQRDALGEDGNDRCPPPEQIHNLLLKHSRAESTPCSKHSEKRLLRPVDVGTQTTLSLPPVLPDELAALLEPYMKTKDVSTFNHVVKHNSNVGGFIGQQKHDTLHITSFHCLQIDSMVGDDVNTSSNTLRRKLFFHNNDELVSPVKCNYLDDEWNHKDDRPKMRQCWTPIDKGQTGSSPYGELPATPDISPIKMAGSETPPPADSLATTPKVDRLRKEADEEGSMSDCDFTRDMDVDTSHQGMMSYITNYSEVSNLDLHEVSGGPDGVVVSVRDYYAEGPGFDSLRASYKSPVKSGGGDVSPVPSRPMFSSTIVGCAEDNANRQRVDFNDTAVFTSTRVASNVESMTGRTNSSSSWADTGYHTISGAKSSGSHEESQSPPAVRKKAVLRKKRSSGTQPKGECVVEYWRSLRNHDAI